MLVLAFFLLLTLVLKLLLTLQSKVLREVVLDGRDDGLDKLEEDNEVHMYAKLTPTFHNLK